ncbi:MAG: hypothetical protein KGH64_05955 [Candidatus Micrarchaeota archaeon]|nr:hypothetical protein [Candidatus Micrarchaeota archaeon]MDE1859907.1 hypothetical protein [Candidatus Micrarchaeota archaeon]
MDGKGLNDKVAEQILLGLLENEKDPHVRQAVAFHEYASEEVLLKAAGDLDYTVRLYAIHNPNSTVKVLEAAMAQRQNDTKAKQVSEIASALLATRRPQETTRDAIRDVEAHTVTVAQALRALRKFPVVRGHYSLEEAHEEKPLMHFTRAGNIFQVLRFGIQSNNFKNRVNAIRENNDDAGALAPQMCGFRVRGGPSYQGKDSISLSQYSESMFFKTKEVLVLINPEIKVYGTNPDERDASTGYGHGIKTKMVSGGLEIGNPTAYPSEVVAANIILPSEMRAIVLGQNTSLLSDMNVVAKEITLLYFTQSERDHYAKEDLVANVRLIAKLSGDDKIGLKIDALLANLDNMDYRATAASIVALQKEALAQFVGQGKQLTEKTLRETISTRFNVDFIIR